MPATNGKNSLLRVKTVVFLALLFPFVYNAQPKVFSVHTHETPVESGYYFFSGFGMRKTTEQPFATQMIIDEKGDVIFYNNNSHASDFKVHPDGRISFFADGKFRIMNSFLNIIDSIGCVNGIETDPHDLLFLSNGHYILIGTETVEEDLSTVIISAETNQKGNRNHKVKYGVVQELDADKNLIYQWNSRKYFSISNVDPIYLKGQETLDVTHFNSIEFDKDGNFCISARYSNEIIKVKKQDGSLLWRMGGALNEFKFINDTIPFMGQHDARLLSNGHMTLFDNGYGRHFHSARALEYELDEQNKTAKLVWSYTYPVPFESEATGNMQRLPNGNTLVNYGKIRFMKTNIMFNVVDPEGKTLFDISFADTMGSYRAFYFSSDFVHLQRPVVTVQKQKDGILMSTTSIRNCRWSSGDTTSSILVTSPGAYSVFIPVPSGGYIRSETIVITDKMLPRRIRKRKH